jgi:hypothetical protein
MKKKSLLRSCKACGRDISRHSILCRHCGHPQASPLAVCLLVSSIILMVAFIIVIFFHGLLFIH